MMICSLALGVLLRPSTCAGIIVGAVSAVLTAAERFRKSRRVDPVCAAMDRDPAKAFQQCRDTSILVVPSIVTPLGRLMQPVGHTFLSIKQLLWQTGKSAPRAE